MYRTSDKTLIFYPSTNTDRSFTVPPGTTAISDYAFGDSSLVSITIPDSVTTIGDNAFYGCNDLTAITIPENVVSIGKSPFRNCTNLSAIYVSPQNTVFAE